MSHRCPPPWRAFYEEARAQLHRHRRRASAAILGLALGWGATLAHDVAEEDCPPEVAAAKLEAPLLLTDGAGAWDAIPLVGSLPLPEKPLPNQQTLCDPKRREVRLPNGGCYKEQAGGPPCAEGEYEHGGKCWGAVAKREPVRNTIGP